MLSKNSEREQPSGKRVFPDIHRQMSFLARVVFGLLAAWVILISGLSYLYIRHLTHPPCPPASNEQSGYELVNLLTSDGAALKGWWRPPENDAVILLLGGAGANRDAMLQEAEMLAAHGYGVLTAGYRHCSGKKATLGYREVKDLQAMVDFAIEQPGVEKLGVMGFSVGGTAAILGAAEMPAIDAVVALGNYANLYDEITATPAVPLSLHWQVQQLVAAAYFIQTGMLPRKVSPIDSLPQLAPRPVLLIHGEHEVDRSRGRQQLAAAGENAELWIVPGAGHGGYQAAQPEEFERRIVSFFDENLVSVQSLLWRRSGGM